MRSREFWLWSRPSVLVMFGLLLFPLVPHDAVELPTGQLRRRPATFVGLAQLHRRR